MDAIREHHIGLRDRFARRSEKALATGGRDELNALIALLEGELLDHARAEHDHLYPAVDEVVRQHGRATATMDIDHEAIEKRIRDVGVAVERLRLATERRDRAEAKRILREALLRLEALLGVHMEKEERVYLPLLEAHLTADEQRKLLERLDEHAEAPASEPTLDVRAIPHAVRHEEIFARFARLKIGDAFVIVNDHDPRPLAYEFSQQHPAAFRWEDLERGPLWRVRITRTKNG
ncbi:MAG: DUF2249 domain-containing protein [Chloroflexota bacterium]|nr:DUF2249 domain-containing protein [Chloroflexota bacterium]